MTKRISSSLKSHLAQSYHTLATCWRVDLPRPDPTYILRGDGVPSYDSWTRRAHGKTTTLNGVTYGGGLYVAVGAADGTDAYIITSTDGVTWTERSNPRNRNLRAIAYDGSGVFVAGGESGSANYIIRSTDGVNWTDVTPAGSFKSVYSVAYGNGVWVVMGSDAVGPDQYIARSVDGGLTWTEIAGSSNARNVFRGLAYGNGIFVGVGASQAARNYVGAVRSTNGGLTWTDIQVTTSREISLRSVAYGNGLFVAVGTRSDGVDSDIFTSPDGIVWTERSNPGTSTLNGIAFNNGVFVAVGDLQGSQPLILTSTDGITWTKRTSVNYNAGINGVGYGNGIFVGVGPWNSLPPNYSLVITGPNVAWASDDIAFSQQSAPRALQANDVTWSPGLSKFIAVGEADTADAYVITSPDGVTWTEQRTPKANNLNGVTARSGTALSVQVGEADGTDAYIITSTDGVTWTERSNPKNVSLRGCAHGKNQFVAVGAADGVDAYIVTSPDGVTWTERGNPSNTQLNRVIYAQGQFLAVGEPTGSGAYIITSPDGVTWTQRSNPRAVGLNDVAYGNGTYVAVGDAIDPSGGSSGWLPYVITSPDGIGWTQQQVYSVTLTPWYLFGVAFGNGIFVAVGGAIGKDGTRAGTLVFTSVDGKSWSLREVPNSKYPLYDVAYGNGIFVAVGEADGSDAYMITSVDGVTWTERSNPKNISLYTVSYGKGMFIAAGNANGTDAYVITSTDGITWTERSNPKNKSLYGGIWSRAGVVIAVGNSDGQDALILASNEGVVWEEQSNPKPVHLNGVAWSGTEFVAVGDVESGSDAYLLTSDDGETWTERVALAATPTDLHSAAYGSGVWIVVGEADGTDACILRSTDGGISWAEQSNPKALHLYDVDYSSALGMFCAVGQADNTDAYIVTSTDGGVTWIERANPKNVNLHAVIWIPEHSRFVAMGDGDGTDTYCLQSADGITWTELDTPNNLPIYGLAFPSSPSTIDHVVGVGGAGFTSLGFTDHDQDLLIDGVLYKAATGWTRSNIQADSTLAVDNMDVVGVLDSDSITEADLVGGKYDGARVSVFMVNWADLSQGKLLLPGHGWIGEISVKRGVFQAEIRGLMQSLQQVAGEVYAAVCRADLGDERCKVPLDPPRWNAGTSYSVRQSYDASIGSTVKPTTQTSPPRHFECIKDGISGSSEPAWNTTLGGITVDGTVQWRAIEARTVEGTVASSSNQLTFTSAVVGQMSEGFFTGGVVEFTSGQNRGYRKEVKRHSGSTIELNEGMPYPMAAGDAFKITVGCAKTLAACRDKFNNTYNRRAEDFIPGVDEYLKFGGQ